MNIQVKRLAEKEPLLLTVQASDTVAEIKMLIQENLGIPPRAQKLIHRKKELRDEDVSISECGLLEGSLLVLLVTEPAVSCDYVEIEIIASSDESDMNKQFEDELQKRGLSEADFDQDANQEGVFSFTLSTGEVLDLAAFQERYDHEPPPGTRVKAKLMLRKSSANASLSVNPELMPVTNEATEAAPCSDNLFKLVIVGDSGVGKSNFCKRFHDDTFTDSFIPTIGVDFGVKEMQVETRAVKLQVWDTSGQERFKAITNSYYRGSHAVIFMYDVCERESFSHVDNWLSEVNQYGNDNLSKILIGNKCDMESDRKVATDEGRKKAQELGTAFMETSAKEATNVDSAFEMMVRELIHKRMQQDADKNKCTTLQQNQQDADKKMSTTLQLPT